jgi:hypothetical protein
MCERWKNSFQAFVEDIPPRPSPKHHLHRKENAGSYHPENVEWMTAKERSIKSRRVDKKMMIEKCPSKAVEMMTFIHHARPGSIGTEP